MCDTISYKKKKKYKYKLYSDFEIQTGIKPKGLFVGEFLSIDMNGRLTIGCGYVWDGPSGPAIDSKRFMRGSLVHDALYQLMRNGIICRSKRRKADLLLLLLCMQDGMWKSFAHVRYFFVRVFAGYAAKSDILIAP